jgi:hypothetical protein
VLKGLVARIMAKNKERSAPVPDKASTQTPPPAKAR